jgi:predicted pyridoxine 5'-phosphate oxidase superfamily flavin-nucleotide-binding protein
MVKPEDLPFHVGERAVQVRAGVRERMARIPAHAFRGIMPDSHRALFARLPWFIIGSLDAALQPWASAIVGVPGFVHTPDAQTLVVNALPLYGDPLAEHLRVGAALGMLGIQLETRRRNRVNGLVTAVEPAGFTLQVGQSFGNCNQYIQAREPHLVADPENAQRPHPLHRVGPTLDARARQLIARADTFFIASATPASNGSSAAVHGADVSHRGGNPGFVHVDDSDGATVLTTPDYPGNNFFNTLGNLELWPRAGLLFVDFDRGDVLTVTGTTEVLWDGPELAATPGAERLLRLRIVEGRLIEGVIPLRWSPAQRARELVELGI